MKVNSEGYNAARWFLQAALELTSDYPTDKGEMETTLMKVHAYLYAMDKVLEEE